MVDFNKRLAGGGAQAIVDPVKLYGSLDRAHDKGPLRPAQEAVLEEWFRSRRNDRDIIVKLHTGQGKTLIGLLMLQSLLNDKRGPAVYLCPDNFLIEQTREQARQFGIVTCTAGSELPEDFLNSQSILVTSVQKLFNGLTKFGLHRKSLDVGAILMDDAHACSDAIRDACRIRLPNDDQAYASLLTLFAADLERQGTGTYADICNCKHDAFLPVPYWSWIDRESEIAQVLSAGAERKTIKFAWPILKNMLSECQGIVSGSAFEIEPHIPPLDAFGTFWRAPNRIFMSATVTDDAFLVRGLQLAPDTIYRPLTYERESWSGEKMVLLPGLIHEDLARTEIVNAYAKVTPGRQHGVVALTRGFDATTDWASYGALVATSDTLGPFVDALKRGNFDKTLVLANRYDGIDLPDEVCRVLIFDGRPYSENLVDLYQESVRPDSDATLMRIVRTVEQGMGRSVRGEKDYSVIIVVGTDITRLLRSKASTRYLSPQMLMQIEIGADIAAMARQEILEGKPPMDALGTLVRQCLQRDSGWKQFYAEQMATVLPAASSTQILSRYAAELSAEQLYRAGDYQGAVKELQRLLDAGVLERADAAWYLQEMARYNYREARAESRTKQVAAFGKNRLLLRPTEGVTVAQLTVVSQGRMERIIEWVARHKTYEQLDLALCDILSRLVFGVKADKFEQALDELSRALGFAGERPDKEWKEGPDNLWALDGTQYLLWECKSEVEITRAEINKRETEQMNRSFAWFGKHYPNLRVKCIFVHPTHKVSSAAALLGAAEVMREAELKRLMKAVRAFFKSFERLDLQDLSPSSVQELVNLHKLSTESLVRDYTKALQNSTRPS